ncbi:MAG: 6,7-dimethyl-8-ribityllumazine synthase [Planctomycetota bacterium]
MSVFDGMKGALPSGRIAVIASRYNESICDAMLQGAVSTLQEAGLTDEQLIVVRVSGAWELCWATAEVFQAADVLGAVVLGAVIKGETTHDEHINRAVSCSLMEQSVQAGKPLGFGLLTCNTVDQALQRSGGNVGNKGCEAAEAVLECLRLRENMVTSL